MNELSFYSILGALTRYITHTGANNFQPMNANFGIVYKANKDPKPLVRERALKAIDDLKGIPMAIDYVQEFYNYLRFELNLSINTVKSYIFDVNLFMTFIGKEGVDITEVDKNVIRNFMSERLEHTTYRGNLESERSLSRRVCALRKYFKFLYSKEYLKYNPFIGISSPKRESKILMFYMRLKSKSY